MTRKANRAESQQHGFFEIGIYRAKAGSNVGTLWRSASQLGAAGIFLVDCRFPPQVTDTLKASRHIPLRHHPTWEHFQEARPHSAPLIGVETGGKPLAGFLHPPQAVYLLGSEDNGLPSDVLGACQHVVSIEALRTESYNVAVAGSIVMWHRLVQRQRKDEPE